MSGGKRDSSTELKLPSRADFSGAVRIFGSGNPDHAGICPEQPERYSFRLRDTESSNEL